MKHSYTAYIYCDNGNQNFADLFDILYGNLFVERYNEICNLMDPLYPSLNELWAKYHNVDDEEGYNKFIKDAQETVTNIINFLYPNDPLEYLVDDDNQFCCKVKGQQETYSFRIRSV